jgi:hypothetical protein
VSGIELAKKISQSKSVSIHIRRTDYVSNPNTRRFHGICDMDYYYKAVKMIAGKVHSSNFFLFSDDINWVKENFRIKYPTIFVDHIGSDAEELLLMSLCKHNIIANSSFSWWGAWLNRNLSKIVIAPKKWFKVNVNERDIVPQEWIRI